MRRLIFAICVLAVLKFGGGPLNAQWNSAVAKVHGRVLDDQGNPVQGARISVFALDLSGSVPTPPEPYTDKEGRYKLLLPAYPGRTRFCAVKEGDGYPDKQGLLFQSAEDDMPIVSLVPGQDLEINLRLGPAYGILEGVVIDAESKLPVPTARITLRRKDVDAMYSSSIKEDSTFVFALPPSPIEISVSAPGYQTWRYKTSANSVDRIVVHPHEHKKLVIEVTPNKTKTPQPPRRDSLPDK